MVALTAAMLAPVLMQAMTGGYQMIKGNQMGQTKRPDFIIPQSQIQSLDVAKGLASQRNLPGQSIIEDKMRGSTASGVNALKQVGIGGNTMGAMVDLFTNEQSGLRDLGVKAEENWRNNQGMLMGQLQNMAQWENKKNDWNVYDPYREKMREATMMKEGGLQNVMGSLNALPSNMMNASMFNSLSDNQSSSDSGNNSNVQQLLMGLLSGAQGSQQGSYTGMNFPQMNSPFNPSGFAFGSNNPLKFFGK